MSISEKSGGGFHGITLRSRNILIKPLKGIPSDAWIRSI